MTKFLFPILAVLAFLAGNGPARADGYEVGCKDTAFKLIGPDHKVCVYAFDDPAVPGVTCHISQARKGGISGGLGLAEDVSEFSIACRQTGPIDIDLARLPQKAEVFDTRTSIFFKSTSVTRLVDLRHRTLIYLAISDKLIEGSPKNSLSTVPVIPWH